MLRQAYATDHGTMAQPVKTSTTTAFYIQAVVSFAISLAAMAAGILYLPVTAWVRSFLALGLMYMVTSTFTLAKCVRDRQEESSVVSRVDQARIDKLLAEHDPFRAD